MTSHVLGDPPQKVMGSFVLRASTVFDYTIVLSLRGLIDYNEVLCKPGFKPVLRYKQLRVLATDMDLLKGSR